MTEIICMVSGEGPRYPPVKLVSFRRCEFSGATEAAIVEFEMPIMKFSSWWKGPMKAGVLTQRSSGVSLFPISEWPFPARLFRYTGDLNASRIEQGQLEHLDSPLLCNSLQQAQEIYDQKWD